MTCDTHGISLAHISHDFLETLYRNLRKVLDVGAFRRGFSDLQIVRRVPPRCQKVSNVLVVNLKVRYPDCVAHARALIALDPLEQVLAGSWNDTGVFGVSHLEFLLIS